MYCGFGVQLEKGNNRFQSLAKTHPVQYEYFKTNFKDLMEKFEIAA